MAVLPILHQVYACHKIERKGEGIIEINDNGDQLVTDQYRKYQPKIIYYMNI